jgi:hypothetical protein
LIFYHQSSITERNDKIPFGGVTRLEDSALN